MFRQQGKSVEAATTYLAGLSIAEKNELLFRQGINFNELPNWQKRGFASSGKLPESKTAGLACLGEPGGL